MVIQLTILPTGEIGETKFLERSNPVLNQAALAAVYSAAPFPNIEDEIDMDSIKINVPINYNPVVENTGKN